jgi:hypothetical protein
MSEGQGTPGRRLRLVPSRRSTAPAEPARVEALDALLREVDGLRLTLEIDLSLAASAVESGVPRVAVEILSNDRDALRRFEERALDHLATLDRRAPHKGVWAQAHAAPIVAAAALVGLLVGVVPHIVRPTDAPTSAVAASDSLERLEELARHGDADQVRAASIALHQQLAAAVANAKTDPAAAQNALLLLRYEQSAIALSGDSRALADVMRQSEALSRAIVAALPPAARSAVPALEAVSAEPEPSSSPKPKPKPSASSSPRPRPSASSQPSASPSPSRRDPYPLPSSPIAP